MVAEHVHHADRRQADAEQVGTLHFAGTHQQAAVRTARDGEFLRRGIFVGNEVFGRCDEIIENILFFVQHAALVPLFSVFQAAAQVGYAINAALFHEHNGSRVEPGREADLEPTVSVEVTGVVAVELQSVAIDDEHRDFRAVLAGVEHLFRSVVFGVEFHFGTLIQGRFARCEVVTVNGRRCREVGQRIEGLRFAFFTGESACRSDGGQLDFPNELAVPVVLVNLALGILQVGSHQIVARFADDLKHILRIFGDNLLDHRRIIQVDADHAVVGSIEVGTHVKFIVLGANNLVVVGKAGKQHLELLIAAFSVEDLTARRTLRCRDEKPLAVLADTGSEIAQRMLCVHMNQTIGRLGLTERVIIHLLILVLGRIDARFRNVERTIIESLFVGSPHCVGELHPFYDIARGLLVRRTDDMNVAPVRT